MSARVCPVCDVAWPATETYETSFGSKTARPINESCPACGNRAWYDGGRNPSPEEDRNEILALVQAHNARAQVLQDFEEYYQQHAILQLYTDLESWLSPEPV